MNYFDEVYSRIKFATNVRTQVELAKMLEIRQSSISDAKRRRSIPAEWFIKLYDKYGLNVDWLRWGIGSMYVNKESSPLPPEGAEEGTGTLKEQGPVSVPLAQSEVVRVLSTACEYKEEGGVPDFATHSYLMVPEAFYSQEMSVFYIDNASMEPTLKKGAYAGITPAPHYLVSGEIYALLMPYEGVVFRRIVQNSEKGVYMLCSEQNLIPSMSLPVETLRQRLVGKLSWVLQHM